MKISTLRDLLIRFGMPGWAADVERQLDGYHANLKHGDLPRWQEMLATLPDINPVEIDLDCRSIKIGTCTGVDRGREDKLRNCIVQLAPWRKGPFNLFGIEVDAEWRSDMKWERVRRHISSLHNRSVLDVGCGNGYFSLRMLGAGAGLVVGIDPVLRYVTQFQFLQHFLQTCAVKVLPFRLEQLVQSALRFDTVFSMGVLYHNPEPQQHVKHLGRCLRPGGELVLETLVVGDDHDGDLYPRQRYARMKNISMIPMTGTVMQWLNYANFTGCRLVDVNTTTTEEQRATALSGPCSLADFLDPSDPGRTIEGYPAPRRAIFIATRDSSD